MPEHLVEDLEQQRVGGGLVERPRLGEQRVDPLGRESLERVAARPGRLEHPAEVRPRGLDILAGHHAVDDHVAVVDQAPRDLGTGSVCRLHRPGHRDLPVPLIAPRDRQDSSDQRDIPDSTEAKLSAEPTEKTDANEPAEPIDRIEPLEPIDRIEPLDPIDRIEPLDPMLSSESEGACEPAGTVVRAHAGILAASPGRHQQPGSPAAAWRHRAAG